MDIRNYTGIIIEKNGEFLIGYCVITNALRWSNSPYDAWITRKRDKAFVVADKVQGTRYLFNPIAAQLRKMKV